MINNKLLFTLALGAAAVFALQFNAMKADQKVEPNAAKKVEKKADLYTHRIAYPANYQKEFTHYASIDRESNDAQISEIYANKAAVEGMKADGKMPDGSVLVMEIYNAKMDKEEEPVLDGKGRRIKAGMKVIAVMQKQAGWGDTAPKDLKNGDWDYVFFSPKSQKPLKKDYKVCFQCHAPLGDKVEFSFSYQKLLDHLKK